MKCNFKNVKVASFLKNMFKKSGKTPFTPFTCNKLIYRMLNKKVKGEGLKTLFIYVRVGKEKRG